MSEKIHTLCVECGFDVFIDEDGCCLSCGRDAIGDYADEAGRLKAERDEAMIALCHLTPGGSEYANDINACVEYVRYSKNNIYETLKRQVKLRKEAQAERDALKKELKLIKKVFASLEIENRKYRDNWQPRESGE